MIKTNFDDFLNELEVEAKAEGPKAEEELKAFDRYFKRVHRWHKIKAWFIRVLTEGIK